MLDIVSVIFNILQVQNGGGRHMIYLTLHQIIEAAKFLQLAEILAIFASGLTKISICLFVIRIPNSKRLVTSLYVLIGALVVVNLAYAMILCLQCRPIEHLWNPFVHGSCWNKNVYLISGYLQGGSSSTNIYVGEYRTDSVPFSFLYNYRSYVHGSSYCGFMECADIPSNENCYMCFNGNWLVVSLFFSTFA